LFCFPEMDVAVDVAVAPNYFASGGRHIPLPWSLTLEVL